MAGKKRKVKDEPIILDENFLNTLLQTVQKIEWPYKVNTSQLQQRDQALVCFFILTGIRNAESQTIKKKQIRSYKTHILVVNHQPSKNGNLRSEIILPKKGGLAPFTAIFEKWLQQVLDPECILFPTSNSEGKLNWNKPLGRKRVHQLIQATCGMFPHWFRGVCETLYGKQVFKNNLFALQEFMGVKNIQNLVPYVSGQWKQYEKNIYNL